MNLSPCPRPAPGPAAGSAAFAARGTAVKSKISQYFSEGMNFEGFQRGIWLAWQL